ncbi:MAG TPA: sulfatase/phosphatase domain-containing protein, partial [Acidobacteriota bacterium]|nr:sulfatase/phosphatase domain-containing protein [Acidobacteriota bacterium]
EELLDHGFVGHASTSLHARLYEEFIHIPLVVAWPGQLPQGKRDRRLASQVDIFPTLLRQMGWEIPGFVQGHDLLSPPPLERTLFFQSVIAGNQTTKEREHLWVYGLHNGRFKYIEGEDGPELYDLKNDPSEVQNLAPERPARVKALAGRLQEWRERSGELAGEIFASRPQVHTSAKAESCPVIYTPGEDERLKWDTHTGSLLFDWSGDLDTEYVVEYDIGTGDHHIAGTHEVEGNHQLLGPFPSEIWVTLKDWNPVKIRVSPKTQPRCWSEWRTFKF